MKILLLYPTADLQKVEFTHLGSGNKGKRFGAGKFRRENTLSHDNRKNSD